ncbi:MAG: MATE family efflux transporter [Phycisphaerales bacterium]|nr:MATE family efflux transporter [Phycisphaerales bacterium]
MGQGKALYMGGITDNQAVDTRGSIEEPLIPAEEPLVLDYFRQGDAGGAVYTRGSIGGTMIRNTLGMLAGTLAMSGYNIAGAYFIGHLPGHESLAAMGFTFPVVMLAACLFRGLSAGITTPTAHALGARRRRRAEGLATSGLLLTVLFSVTFGVAGMATIDPVFRLFDAHGEVLRLVREYMHIWYLGCVTASLAMAGNDLLLTVGAPKTASAMMIVGMVINIMLDPLFIFGWGPVPAMGVRGAAVGTVIAQGLSACLVLWVVYHKYKMIRFSRMPWRVMGRRWRIVVRFGVPVALGMFLQPLGVAVVIRAASSFGNAAIAAVAAASRLEILAFMVPMAFGVTMTAVVGQNFGARLYSRIGQCRRFAMRFALCYLTFAGVMFVVFSKGLAGLFSNDPEVQRIMTINLRIIPWGFAFLEIHRFSTFVFTGSGKPGAAALLNTLRMVGLLIPLTVLAWWLGWLPGVFGARLAADVLAGVIGWTLARGLTRRFPADGLPFPFPAVAAVTGGGVGGEG